MMVPSFLILAGKAWVILSGRLAASTGDVQALARPVLQHRLIMGYREEAEGIKPAQVIDRQVATIPSFARRASRRRLAQTVARPLQRSPTRIVPTLWT